MDYSIPDSLSLLNVFNLSTKRSRCMVHGGVQGSLQTSNPPIYISSNIFFKSCWCKTILVFHSTDPEIC